MDAINGLSLVSAMPVCHGKAQRGRKGETPERFLRQLQLFIGSLPAATTDTQKINLVTRNLRGEAQDWWVYTCNPAENAPSIYDRRRIKEDFDYFVAQFKAQFYSIADTTALTDDISDVLQRDAEALTSFLDRLMYTLRPVTVQMQERGTRRAEQHDYTECIPNWFLLELDAAFRPDNPIPLLRARVNQAIQEIAINAGRMATILDVYDHEYLNVARTAIRNTKHEWAKSALRKHMHPDMMDLRQLREAVEKVEKTKRQGADFASNIVSVINDEDEQDGTDQYDGEEEEYDQDVEEDEESYDETIAPIRGGRGFRGRGRGRGGRAAPRGGRGRGKGPAGNTAGAPRKPSATSSKWCWWCLSSTHDTEVCRSIKSAREQINANKPQKSRKPRGQQQQQQQAQPAQQPQPAQPPPAWQQPMDVDAAAANASSNAVYIDPAVIDYRPAVNY